MGKEFREQCYYLPNCVSWSNLIATAGLQNRAVLNYKPYGTFKNNEVNINP